MQIFSLHVFHRKQKKKNGVIKEECFKKLLADKEMYATIFIYYNIKVC